MSKEQVTIDSQIQSASDLVPLSTANYWENRLRENWGLHGVGHISYGKRYNHWLYRVRRQVFLREIKSVDVDWKSVDVLDVGSGTGFWIETWKKVQVRSITGSDLTQTAVDHLREVYSESSILKMDISGSLDEQHVTNKYGIVSAFDVLFHIVEDRRFAASIENISRLLVPGGLFIFSDNFLHGAATRASHQVGRTIDDITATLKNFGLTPVRRVPMFILMNTPIDTVNHWPLTLWRLAMLPVREIPFLGSLYGSMLYPIEMSLTRFLKESPTTEMMICKKTETL